MIERCAGLDVHKASVTATCAGAGRPRRAPDRDPDVSGHDRGVGAAGDWLASFGVTVVGMESTGVYWKPVYYLLEDDFECWLLNAQHLKNVPGRKTDVADCGVDLPAGRAWPGPPVFVPPQPIRELRDLTRYRKALIARAHPRGPAAAQGAGGCRDQAGLRGHATCWGSRAGRCWRRWSAGPTDPQVLAELARGQLRSQAPGVAGGARGPLCAPPSLLVAEMLAHIDYLEEAIARLSARGRPRDRPFLAAAGVADDDPGGEPADR